MTRGHILEDDMLTPGQDMAATVLGLASVSGGVGMFLVYRNPYRNSLTRLWYRHVCRTTKGISADAYLLTGAVALVGIGVWLVFGVI